MPEPQSLAENEDKKSNEESLEREKSIDSTTTTTTTTQRSVIIIPRSKSQATSRRVAPTSISDASSANVIEKHLPNGDLYLGTFSSNTLHGSGKYLWEDGCMYEGEWKKGKASGKGKFSWPSGATFEGEFKSGRMEGTGTFIGPDGDMYRGSWSGDRKHGYGVKHYSNGDYYEGQWKKNLQDGQGRYLWSNGNEYIGDWKNGVIHGRGVLVWSNGNRYDGNWENGVPKGQGVFTWPDGSCYIGCWANDSVGKHASILRDLKLSDFDPKEKFWTRFPSEGSKITPPHQSAEFRWKDYNPVVFRFFKSRNSPNFSYSPNRCVITTWQKGELLGSGSFGSVYEGITDEGFFFAIKQVSLLDQGSEGRQSITQLEQEIALLSQFKHENIVQYYGTEKDESHLYIFIELVTKGSLLSLYQKYTLREKAVSSYTRQILHGLKYLHNQGVVHRDIKCANILVDTNGVVKLADFGLAKATKLNDVKSCKGTAFWMAPEVVRSQGGYGVSADIWSLGCTVLEMLTGRFPYGNLEWMQALFKTGRGERPEIPDSLSKVAQDFILKCLQVDPSSRPTATQLLDHPFVKRPLQYALGFASPGHFI